MDWQICPIPVFMPKLSQSYPFKLQITKYTLFLLRNIFKLWNQMNLLHTLVDMNLVNILKNISKDDPIFSKLTRSRNICLSFEDMTHWVHMRSSFAYYQCIQRQLIVQSVFKTCESILSIEWQTKIICN